MAVTHGGQDSASDATARGRDRRKYLFPMAHSLVALKAQNSHDVGCGETTQLRELGLALLTPKQSLERFPWGQVCRVPVASPVLFGITEGGQVHVLNLRRCERFAQRSLGKACLSADGREPDIRHDLDMLTSEELYQRALIEPFVPNTEGTGRRSPHRGAVEGNEIVIARPGCGQQPRHHAKAGINGVAGLDLGQGAPRHATSGRQLL
jgi:hypothetical protein